MKTKELKELRNKETAELAKLANKKKEELIKLGPQLKVGKEKNPKKARNLRREIAQILTILREKEINQKEKNENI